MCAASARIPNQPCGGVVTSYDVTIPLAQMRINLLIIFSSVCTSVRLTTFTMLCRMWRRDEFSDVARFTAKLWRKEMLDIKTKISVQMLSIYKTKTKVTLLPNLIAVLINRQHLLRLKRCHQPISLFSSRGSIKTRDDNQCPSHEHQGCSCYFRGWG